MKIKHERHGFSHYCPGCELYHYISVEDPGGCNWNFDGDLVAPTFSPSVKHYQPWMPNGGICHYFIQNGMLNYCGDCTHSLSGQSVPLPELPDENQCST